MESKFTKANVLKLVDLLEKMGDMITLTGELEKEMGPLDKFTEILSKVDLPTILSKLEGKPELATKLGTLMVRFMAIYPKLQKKFSESSPDEKVQLGKSIKEMAITMKEMVEMIG